MTRFRPCIDLHAGQVKQIVGGTLDSTTTALQTNFVSPHPPAHFAKLYRDHNLTGAHGRYSQERLDAVLHALGGDKERLVIDLSCRRRGDDRWFVAMNKWQTITDMEVNAESIRQLEPYCSEFLIHAADNEGLQKGVDKTLVQRLAEWASIPVTYAGGGRHLEDLDAVKRLSDGKVDLTIGSALDCFGGNGVKLEECVQWNRQQPESGA
ncbi:5-proFAR isomerase [Verticillium alfalfae VaMs.102]|uniref:5-proFAR isomerase n=1 Tax=Verticillium alfalfae (strain VaMs.102 / ATCC MYA-4576 / FGSC 10136) TaxID=526221 RepID=C9SVG4_VERA1|nr:5-proFAR isomerase [Verticillium alfalfae VaMs.102]EEY22779.1 5-proFAR isomerase [Verticillium alfalfae VaMs.102]